MHPALAVLEAQREAWNQGDLEGYLAGCAPDVVYVSARGVVVGRAALRASMSAAYPDRSAMGTLVLEVLRVDPAGDPAIDGATACVVLRWCVVTEAKTVGGHALVVLRRSDGAWRMSHDATIA